MESQRLGFKCLDRMQVSQGGIEGLVRLKQSQHLVIENTPGRENGVPGVLPEAYP